MKIIVSDLDGTLLDENSKITDYTRETIKKLNRLGIEFIIATGRGEASAIRFKNQLGIDTYIICNNGANIYDKDENMIFEKVISKDVTYELLKLLREEKVNYNCFFHEDFYRDEYDKTDYSRRTGFIEHVLVDLKDCSELNKIIIVDEEEIILNLSKKLKDRFSHLVEITISDPTCVDIAPKDCSKGNALEILADTLNFNMDKIIAFGDAENDLDMLKKVGHPVVMENAQAIVKDSINNRAGKNSEDGVAKYLENYFQLKK